MPSPRSGPASIGPRCGGPGPGLRPVTADGLPIIGPEPRLAGLWYASGHGRNGILLAALTGRLVRQLIAGEPLVEDISRCAPERFWTW